VSAEVLGTVAALAPGTSLGGWQLEERIAEGPFSEVWRARGLSHDRPAAVKVARTSVGVRMLREEYAVARRLRYNTDRVVRVIEFHDGEPQVAPPAVSYLVMPWIPRTFRDVLNDVTTADDRARALKLFSRVVDAVGEVHMLGVVHGDLKPENVLIEDVFGEPIPRVADFGLAKQLREVRLGQSLRQSLQTDDGLTGGTLAYMPPEAVKGGEPTYQGDVYALGVMLHETLLGRRPGKATSADALRSTLPEEAVAVLLRALAYEPAARYGRAGQLETDLRHGLGDLRLTGLGRRVNALKRFVLAGLAAFFVALRYASVAALLGTYLGLIGLVLSLCLAEGPVGLIALTSFLPFFFLHVFVRWEGPETPAEAAARTGFWQR
jgi:serine/threonine protein kinase